MEIETYALAAIGGAQGVWRYYIRPELTAKRGWLMVGAVVVAHEVACPRGETLSEGVDKAIERFPVATAIGVGYTALHLLNVIPDKLDPLHILATSFK